MYKNNILKLDVQDKKYIEVIKILYGAVAGMIGLSFLYTILEYSIFVVESWEVEFIDSNISPLVRLCCKILFILVFNYFVVQLYYILIDKKIKLFLIISLYIILILKLFMNIIKIYYIFIINYLYKINICNLKEKIEKFFNEEVIGGWIKEKGRWKEMKKGEDVDLKKIKKEKYIYEE